MTSPTHNPARHLTHSYRATTATINAARVDLDQWLVASGVDSVRPNAELVISELVSNAVQSSEGATYRVEAHLDPGRLTLTVSNRSRGVIPPPDEWGPHEVLATSGRGLTIVRALCDDVHIDVDDGDITVTVQLQIPDGPSEVDTHNGD